MARLSSTVSRCSDTSRFYDWAQHWQRPKAEGGEGPFCRIPAKLAMLRSAIASWCHCSSHCNSPRRRNQPASISNPKLHVTVASDTVACRSIGARPTADDDGQPTTTATMPTTTTTTDKPGAAAPPPEHLGVPSRNPLPLSASQESQVRDIYYARVRKNCTEEIKGRRRPWTLRQTERTGCNGQTAS
jgi:hypothetical protein